MDSNETKWHDETIIMAELARVTRLRPPSPAARRVEFGYVLLEVAMVATLLGLAIALAWTPIPERAIPAPAGALGANRLQTL
jgi:hypothetical protein